VGLYKSACEENHCPVLKALIDVTPVTPNPSGVGLYVINLVRALQAIAAESAQPGHRVETLFQPGLKNWLMRRPSVPEISCGQQPCHVWDLPVRLSTPLLAGAYHIDPLQEWLVSHLDHRFDEAGIIHGTNYSVCPSRKAKTVMSIYDLTFIRYPEFVDSVVQNYRVQVERCLSWTDLVVTISESSKRDIVKYLGVDAERVWVTPLASQYAAAACPTPHPLNAKLGCVPELGSAREATGLAQASDRLRLGELGGGPTLATQISQKGVSSRPRTDLASTIRYEETHRVLDDLAKSSSYDRQRPYLLFVSTIEPRKNIANLVEAFNQLKSTHAIDHDLLLVGKKGWHYGPIFEAIARSPWRNHIHHLNYLSDRQVQALYSHADVFVYPSFYEGFGLPVLEAMTLGAPVVTSNVSSLPEVGGDAALYADPYDSAELSEQIWRLIDSPSLRENLIVKGRAQAAKFSWRRTAEETLKAYRSLL